MRHTIVLNPYFAHFQCITLMLTYEMNALVRTLDHYMQEISVVHRSLKVFTSHSCISQKLYKLQVVSNWTLGLGDVGNTTASASGESSGILEMLTLFSANAIGKGTRPKK